MREFITSRIASFGHAFHGWAFVVRYEKNAWIHAVATICVAIVAAWLNISLRDVAVLVLAVAMVWTAEILNTSIEAVVDLASPTHHPLAKVGKDVGAAAVLIAATAAVIIGLLILGPPLWHKLFG
jgi:diacylglycerol kinase